MCVGVGVSMVSVCERARVGVCGNNRLLDLTFSPQHLQGSFVKQIQTSMDFEIESEPSETHLIMSKIMYPSV